MPFEGCGVIRKWRLELPAFRQFDYHTISDVIIHLKYTACEGGKRLKSAATKSVENWLKSIEQELNETGLQVALNMKHDLPNEWHLFKKNGSVELKIDKSRLPYMAQSVEATAAIEDVIFVAKVKNNPASYAIKIDGNDTNLSRINEWKLCRGNNTDIKLDTSFKLSIPAQLENVENLVENLEELMLVVKYIIP